MTKKIKIIVQCHDALSEEAHLKFRNNKFPDTLSVKPIKGEFICGANNICYEIDQIVYHVDANHKNVLILIVKPYFKYELIKEKL